MKKTIHVSGNTIEKLDSFSVKLIPHLAKKFPQINFAHFDPTEELPPNTKELIIIDTVVGIHKVTKFTDFTHWVLSPRNSVHDYDLPLHLGISKKLERIKKITIIGIPTKGERNKILENVKKLLNSL